MYSRIFQCLTMVNMLVATSCTVLCVERGMSVMLGVDAGGWSGSGTKSSCWNPRLNDTRCSSPGKACRLRECWNGGVLVGQIRQILLYGGECTTAGGTYGHWGSHWVSSRLLWLDLCSMTLLSTATTATTPRLLSVLLNCLCRVTLCCTSSTKKNFRVNWSKFFFWHMPFLSTQPIV